MGGSSHADNQAIVDEQQKQSDDAQRKEDKRQKNITKGMASIKAAFEGTPVTKATSHAFDWKKFNDKTVLPTGYKRVQIDPKTGKALAGTPAQAATSGGAVFDPNAGTAGYGYGASNVTLTPGKAAVAAAPATGGVTAIMGPDGKIHKVGQAFNYNTNDPTGAVTGGPQPILDKFKNTYLDYYNGQLADRYGQAKSEAAFRLARAGLGVSSAANTVDADLTGQNAANSAGFALEADKQTNALAGKFSDEEKAARTQLYQTEDPELAATDALSSVRNLSLESPSLSPIAQIFDIASIGGANLLKNYNNNSMYNQFKTGLPNSADNSTIHGGGN